MKKKAGSRWKLPAILIGAVVVISLFTQRSQEPRYQGKRLSQWFAGFDADASEQQRAGANEAIRQMGTNIVPNLMRMLSPQATLSRRQAAASPDAGKQQQERAIAGFQALGDAAIPVLSDLLDGESGSIAANALAELGPKAFEVLRGALKHEDASVRERVEAGLKLDATNSVVLVPLLVENLKHADSRVRGYAARVLASASHLSAEELGALIATLKDSDEEVRLLAVEALAEIGTNATPAILPLLEVARETSGKLSRAAFSALAAIDPDAAKKAGVR